MIRACATLAAVALLAAGCAQVPGQDHPLSGRIWDTRAGAFIDSATLWERVAQARHLLIGEIHDNPVQHRHQLAALEALSLKGQRRALAMEQFDSEHQAALEAALGAGGDAERVADAGRFDRKGWDWPLYRPLVHFAATHRWPLRAANLSRKEARALRGRPLSLPPAAPALRAAIERDMVEGHCGYRPDAGTLAAMVDVQRMRDARMAQVLESAGRSVLIAGNGHVRRDRGVPLYLKAGELSVIGQIEVREGANHPEDYLDSGFASARSYDFVWFTPRAAREDPCKRFRPATRPISRTLSVKVSWSSGQPRSASQG